MLFYTCTVRKYTLLEKDLFHLKMVSKKMPKTPDTQATIWRKFWSCSYRTNCNSHPFLNSSTPASDTPSIPVSKLSHSLVLIYSPVHTKQTPICKVSFAACWVLWRSSTEYAYKLISYFFYKEKVFRNLLTNAFWPVSLTWILDICNLNWTGLYSKQRWLLNNPHTL